MSAPSSITVTVPIMFVLCATVGAVAATVHEPAAVSTVLCARASAAKGRFETDNSQPVLAWERGFMYHEPIHAHRGRRPNAFRGGTRGMSAATLLQALWGFRQGGRGYGGG